MEADPKHFLTAHYAFAVTWCWSHSVAVFGCGVWTTACQLRYLVVEYCYFVQHCFSVWQFQQTRQQGKLLKSK